MLGSMHMNFHKKDPVLTCKKRRKGGREGGRKGGREREKKRMID